ncbi:hypothetical protein I6N90_05250 [Paenibacillus sp. GSMTC-2017]|uniref:hypothetical protein n=1 Tax=Paenibacillus sp. GSMTC-2017 TaxID=2794350 RepID=UPI0018D82C52|nr:hypothetical protein [Paenibacillus sp. GSMTC-2017]MBH5317215.1 hypothetical protein [Paenibacillus sp. GSMTC-2017]
MKNKVLILMLIFLVFISGCMGQGNMSNKRLVESTSIVTEKYINEAGEYVIKTFNNAGGKKNEVLKVNNKNLWESMDINDYVTFRYGDGKQTYIKSVNKKLTYDKLTGNVKDTFESDGNYFVVFHFDQIGEELTQLNQSAWEGFVVGQKVEFKIDDLGYPVIK